MAITYHYEADTKIIRAKASGVVNAKDLLDYLNSIIEDGRIEINFVEIVDFELVTDLVITYSDSGHFSHIWEKYMKKGCKAVLIYAPTDQSYGIHRMLETVIGMQHEYAEDHFVVVRSKDELENKLKEILA
jgi:hypothetical protein